jgi:hypothetical protein
MSLSPSPSCPCPCPCSPNPFCKQLLAAEVGVLGCVHGSGHGLHASHSHCCSCLLLSPSVIIIPVPVPIPSLSLFLLPPTHPVSSCWRWRRGCWVMFVVLAMVFMPVIPITVPLALSFHLPLTIFSLFCPVLSALVLLGCVEPGLWHGWHLGGASGDMVGYEGLGVCTWQAFPCRNLLAPLVCCPSPAIPCHPTCQPPHEQWLIGEPSVSNICKRFL